MAAVVVAAVGLEDLRVLADQVAADLLHRQLPQVMAQTILAVVAAVTNIMMALGQVVTEEKDSLL
jgi:hypothetical protein